MLWGVHPILYFSSVHEVNPLNHLSRLLERKPLLQTSRRFHFNVSATGATVYTENGIIAAGRQKKEQFMLYDLYRVNTP